LDYREAALLLASAMASFNPALASGEVAGAAPELYFVDAHSQVDAEVGGNAERLWRLEPPH